MCSFALDGRLGYFQALLLAVLLGMLPSDKEPSSLWNCSLSGWMDAGL